MSQGWAFVDAFPLVNRATKTDRPNTGARLKP